MDSGKIIGGVSLSFMAFRTSSENKPPQADRPASEESENIKSYLVLGFCLDTYDNVWFNHFHSFQQTFSFHFSIWDCKT